MTPQQELMQLRAEFAATGQLTPQQADERQELERLRAEYEVSQHPVASGLNMLGRGATFGFNDELAGAVTAPFTQTKTIGYEGRDTPDRLLYASRAGQEDQPFMQPRDKTFFEQYQHNRDIIRQDQQNFEEARPGAALGLEIAGSIPASMVAAPAKIPGMVARAVGEGAAYGLGSSNEANPEALATDTAIGAAVGGAAGLVGAGLSKAAQAFTPPSAEKQAQRLILDTIENAPGGEAQVLRNAGQLPAEGAMVNAMDSEGTALGQGAIGVSPFRAKQAARELTDLQNDTSTGRIKNYFNKMLGRSETPDYYGDLTRSMQQRAQQASPLYERAGRNVLQLDDSPSGKELKKLLENRRFNALMNQAREYISDTQGLNIDQIDMLQYKNMNEIVKAVNRILADDPAYTDPIHRTLTPRGRQAKALKDRLLRVMDEQDLSRQIANDGTVVYPGDYATARNIWADRSQLISAMEQGQKEFLRITPSKLRHQLKTMTDPEREAYADGAIEAILNKMGQARTGQMSNYNFLAGENAKEKLRMLLTRRDGTLKADVDNLFTQLDIERSMRNTSNQLLGNSMTALRQQATDALKRGVIDSRTVRFMKQNLLANIFDVLKEKDARFAAQVGEELGELLFHTRGAENIKKLLEQAKVSRAERKAINTVVPQVLNALRLPVIEQAQQVTNGE